MTLRNLDKPELVFFPLVKSSLNFISQFSSGFFNEVSQPFDFQSMISIAILQLVSQTFKICFVELRNLDFVELDFSFVVLDYLLDFVFEFIVVFFDEL